MTTTPESPAAASGDSLLAPDVALPRSVSDHSTSPAAPHRLLIIEAGRVEANYWRDLWLGRELLGFMVWRDIVVRYKQTVIGLAWSILRPFLTMVAGLFIFQRVLHAPPTPGVPYALTLYAAILPWQFFSDGLSGIGTSLVGNAGMLTKIYFPRLMIPLSKLTVSFVDLLFSVIVLALILAWYQFIPSWHIVFVPLFLLLAALSTLGLGLWFAALNVRYRDFIYIIPFVLQFGIYASSVFITTEQVYDHGSFPEWVKFAYTVNPMVQVSDGFRWSLLGNGTPMHWTALACSIVLVILVLFSGHWYFRKTESTFADIV